MDVEKILRHGIVGIAGGEHSGKTNVMFHMIEEAKAYDTAIYCYFFHLKYRQMVVGDSDIQTFQTLEELEAIQNSFVFIDEFEELFQLSNRHMKQQVERVFNMIAHNNNVVVLCGVPRYYRQFIATRVRLWLIKTIKYKDCVNGSALKEYIKNITGDFVGATQIRVPKSKVIVNGVMSDVPYIGKYDKKKTNKNLFIPKKKK